MRLSAPHFPLQPRNDRSCSQVPQSSQACKLRLVLYCRQSAYRSANVATLSHSIACKRRSVVQSYVMRQSKAVHSLFCKACSVRFSRKRIKPGAVPRRVRSRQVISRKRCPEWFSGICVDGVNCRTNIHNMQHRDKNSADWSRASHESTSSTNPGSAHNICSHRAGESSRKRFFDLDLYNI